MNIDPTQLEQVLLNLAVNARDAMPKGGTLIIRCCNRELSPAECEVRPGMVAGPFVQIEVVDNGCGMDEETLRRSLEPFFTTKPVGKGTGLGLATVFGIAQQNRGWFELASKPGEGTTATLLVPKSEGQAAPLSDGAPVDPRGKETVLLVEDEESLRRIARRALEQNGYTVLEAANGEEALQVARKGGEGIRALVADLVMPGMSGKALAEQMKKERPKLKVLYMSGYSPEAQDPQTLLVDGAQFLAKPFEPDDLARSVRRLLDG